MALLRPHVTVTDRTLEVHEPIGGTAAGCPPDRTAQDGWISAVFAADPEYLLDGRRLVLRNGDTVIELAEAFA